MVRDIPQHIPSTSQTLIWRDSHIYPQGTILLLLREYPDPYCIYVNVWDMLLKPTYELEAILSYMYVGGITHPVAKRYTASIFVLFLHFRFSL